jgi:hypothetical protein
LPAFFQSIVRVFCYKKGLSHEVPAIARRFGVGLNPEVLASITSVGNRNTVIHNANESLSTLQFQFIAILVKEYGTLVHTGTHPKPFHVPSAHKNICVPGAYIDCHRPGSIIAIKSKLCALDNKI